WSPVLAERPELGVYSGHGRQLSPPARSATMTGLATFSCCFVVQLGAWNMVLWCC
ncbi:hypothetical protein A2U01_0066596, partial [Trifolium medium]|nr:hypothetical protein [Trifolium medium]